MTPATSLRSPRPSAALRGIGFLAAWLASAGVLHAQQVQGSLVRDEDGAPVTGASVLLLDQAASEVARTRTDSLGTYRLQAPGPGVFMLLIEREGYANHLTETFTLASDEVYTLHLTLRPQRVGETGLTIDTLEGAALLAAAVADACRERFIPALHAIVFGVIRDEMTGEALPGASARLSWNVRGAVGAGPQSLVARTDEVGSYLVCTVPAGTEVTVRPSMSEVDGKDETLQMRAGMMRQLDLTIPLSDPTQPGNLIGRTVDQRTGQPLAGASVHLREASRTVVSNARGVWVMRDVPSGLDVVEVELLGYARVESPVQVIGGRAQEIELRLTTEAVELAPILVSVRPRRWFSDRADLEARIEAGNGLILTHADLEKRSPTLLGDALRGLPGVNVRKSGGALSGRYTVQLRGAANIANQACQPMVWVDGQRWGNDGSAFNEIGGFELEAVEVYRGPSEVPGEFAGGDARCGVIVVWTRRGR